MSLVEGLVLIVLIFSVAVIVLALIQRKSYQGKIVIKTDEDGIHYMLELDGDPYDIQNMKSISFKVVKKEDIAD
jgi:hypothetical protein